MEGKDEYMYSTCKFYYLEKELHPITVQYEGNYTRLQYEGNLQYYTLQMLWKACGVHVWKYVNIFPLSFTLKEHTLYAFVLLHNTKRKWSNDHSAAACWRLTHLPNISTFFSKSSWCQWYCGAFCICEYLQEIKPYSKIL